MRKTADKSPPANPARPAPKKVARGGLVSPAVSDADRERFVMGARDPVIGEPRPPAPPPPEQEERREAPRRPSAAPAEPAEMTTPWAHARPGYTQPYPLRLSEELSLKLKWAKRNTLPARSVNELINDFTEFGIAKLLDEFYYAKLPDAGKPDK